MIVLSWEIVSHQIGSKRYAYSSLNVASTQRVASSILIVASTQRVALRVNYESIMINRG